MRLSAEQLRALRQIELALRVDDPGLTCKFIAWDRILAGGEQDFRWRDAPRRDESPVDAIAAGCCIALMIGLVVAVLAMAIV
jgi:hypothetical protein